VRIFENMKIQLFFSCLLLLVSCHSNNDTKGKNDVPHKTEQLPEVVSENLSKFQEKSSFCIIDTITIKDTLAERISQELVAALALHLFNDENYGDSKYYIQRFLNQTEEQPDSLQEFESECYAMGKMQVNDSLFALFWRLNYTSSNQKEKNDGMLVFASYFNNNRLQKCLQVAKMEEGERPEEELTFDVVQQSRFFNGTEFQTEYVSHLWGAAKKLEELTQEKFIYKLVDNSWQKTKIN